MNHNLLNILSNSNKDIDNQKLMDYLSGKLSEQDNYEVEKWMSENEFANDAMEGLHHFPKQKSLHGYVNELNKELNLYLKQKKLRRERRKITDTSWIYFAVLLVLALIIITYFVVKKMGQ